MATNAVGLQNETAWQTAIDKNSIIASSYPSNGGRNVGSAMGKNDFLMLLSAQLRYQDPLNPQSDSEFAAQLAQFTSLEQMQNMNETLSAMATYQAYGLVGKYVIAEAVVDGVLSSIPGVVDCVFTRNGTTYAVVNGYDLPLSAIQDVFDSSSQLKPESLIQTANSLIGRTVTAQIGESKIEGLVTRITVSNGVMYAQVDDGSGLEKFVQIGQIYDIRQTEPAKETKPAEQKDPAEEKDPAPDTNPEDEIIPEDPTDP